MKLSAYEIALIAGGFTIIGTLLGALIGYYTALRLHRLVELNKAAATFKDAFLPEIIFLKHNTNIGTLGSGDDLSDILRSGYVIRHLKAFEIFSNVLSAKDRLAITKAWQEYCHHPANPNILFFEQYSWKVANKGKNHEIHLKTIALDRIEKILGFAKPK